jgi:peptidoglycan-associated lipoprotein
MRFLRTISIAAAVAAAASPAAAQFSSGDADGGTNSMTILGIPVSPRAVALGEAMGSIDRDPANLWYNAAGLAGLKTNAYTVNAAQRFGQSQLVGVAAAFPTDIAAFGIAARVLNEGTITGTLNGEPTGGNIRAYQYVLEGGGALQLARWWRWGGTLFFSQEVLGDQSQGAVGINSGMQFPEIWGRLSLDGGVRNLGTKVNFDEGFQGFSPPLFGYFGGAYDVFRRRNLLQTPMLFKGEPIIIDAKLVAEGFLPKNDEPYFGGGIEATVNGVAVGRIGYQTGDDNRRGLSLGAGVNVGQFRLEYAFRNSYNGGAKFFTNDPVGDAHNVSFTYFWGEQRSNAPVVPVIVTQPIDTAALNRTVREALDRQLASLRPLLDSLRSQRVEITNEGELVARYVVPVHFGFDSTAIRDSDLVVLGQIADVIKRVYPSALVTIEGFADPSGTVQYNRRLSLRRAEAVKQVMVSRYGLPAGQFKTVGYGESPQRQVTPGARGEATGAEQNRRVTFTIDATQHFQ